MKIIAVIVTIIFCIIGCKPADPVSSNTTSSESLVAITTQYADVAYYSYKNAKTDAEKLQAAIATFTNNPSQSTFDQAKDAWLKSRISYGYTEGFRFYGGPIDEPTTGVEGNLNSWPMDESYIDYTAGTTTLGIINDPMGYPDLSESALKDLNFKDGAGETAVSVGYHAVEFLLWGQDLNPNGSGQRSYTDYLTVGGTNLNQGRRALYLNTIAKLIVKDLEILVKAWDPAMTGNYRSNFIKESETNISLSKILKGLGTFSKGEFGGERMAVAYNTKDQEDEHSCFSDNTTKEFVYWQQSIENIYKGKYFKEDGITAVDGAGLDELIIARNKSLGDSTIMMMNEIKAKIAAIPDPFDNAIQIRDPKIKSAIDALSLQGDQFVKIATELGLKVNTEYCIGVDCKEEK